MKIKTKADGIQICKDEKIWTIKFYTNRSVKIAYYNEEQEEYKNHCILDQFIDSSKLCVEEEEKNIKISLQEQEKDSVQVIFDKITEQIMVQNGTKIVQVLDYDFYEKETEVGILQASKIVFRAEKEEAFYGLGQQQNNILNYAGEKVEVFHNYKAKGGETVGIPFLVSGNSYGIIMNTLAQTTVTPGYEEKTTWEVDCAKDISFIIMIPQTIKELYKEYRTIAGVTPMPLKSALGYIQCKQRYESEDEIREVVTKYRDKKYPLDMVVVDWFYWKHLGDMKMNPEYWPTPKEMTEEFLKLNVDTMISVWPRFMKESLYYDELESKGWFMKDQNGDTLYGTEDDQRGALIDTTNPECAKWYWSVIKENLGSNGFCSWWTDENEPDLWPYEYSLHAGKGYEIFNLYPYTHTEAIYTGHREAYKKRCNILSRSAYLGAQKFGTQFWSSDVYPTWGVLQKQVPTAINFSATGMGYWSSDIGGWQALPDYHGKSTFGVDELLLETQGATEGVVTSKEYNELYARWFAFGAFCPIFRAHGTRDENEVWSYGEETEKILVKFLKLRYQLMPYLYAMAYQLHTTGVPILRGLFLEFEDNKVKDIKDEYMFGESLLVAPITEQGTVEREVYLPSDCGWYDFWTNEKYAGGTTLTVFAPLDSIPLFVKDNTILPVGNEVESTKDVQNEITLRIYGDGDAQFIMYYDDGTTYNYENGNFDLVVIKKKDNAVVIEQSKKIQSEMQFEVEYYK